MVVVNKHNVDMEANMSYHEMHVVCLALRNLQEVISNGQEPGNYIDVSEDVDKIKRTASKLLEDFQAVR